MNHKLQAKDIKPLLDSLIVETEIVDKALASRLRQIKTWIKNTKPGSLSKKRELIFFLRELIEDVEIWLALKELDTISRQLALKELTPTERYWFTDLFPKWFKQIDPKLSIWKKELMAGNFKSKDREVLNIISEKIKKRNGSITVRYICDLSMATDLIASGIENQPLSVQLTITNEYLLEKKKTNWRDTLNYWNIQRAIFISYNPLSKTENKLEVINRLCDNILDKANTLPDSCYIEDNIE